MRRLVGSILLFAGLSVSTAEAGEIYKWVDDRGNVHYTDRAPAEAGDSQSLELESPAAPSPEQRRRQDKQRRLLEAFEAERAERADAQSRELAAKQAKAARCERARRQLAQVERANLVYIRDDDGERKYLSDEERAKAVSETKAWIAKWCR